VNVHITIRDEPDFATVPAPATRPEVLHNSARLAATSPRACTNALRFATSADATKAAPDLTPEVVEIDVPLGKPCSMSVIEFCLSLLALGDDGIQQRHLLGQQRDVVKITLLKQLDDRLESLIDVSVKLPSLLDTFGSRFMFGGFTTALVGHQGDPSQVTPPMKRKRKRALGLRPKPVQLSSSVWY
jgi:hypothetical protein